MRFFGQREANTVLRPTIKVLMRTRRTATKQLSDEAQLLKEGGQLLSRAVGLAIQTSKIRIWVPLVASSVLSGYYLYTLHRKSSDAINFPPPPSRPSAVVVAETAPQSSSIAPGAADNYVEIRKRAEQAHAAQQFGDEAGLWKQFMERAPLPQEACPAIGKAYERVGEIDESIAAYEQCVSFEPGNPDLLIAFAHAVQGKRDFNRAAALYHQAILKDPRNLDAQTGLALVDLKQNQVQDADAAAAKILRQAPENTDALLIAGIAAWREGRLEDAQRIFLRGAKLDDRRADFHGFLGRIAEAERRPEEALQQYERALALDSTDSDIAERRDRLKETRR